MEEGEDVCEELRKRKIDVCCLQVRWRGQVARDEMEGDIGCGGVEE